MRDDTAAERLVIAAVADACRLDPVAIGPATPLLDLHLDSLTLVAVLTSIELECGCRFAPNDIAKLLCAKDVASLAAAVAARLRENAANQRELASFGCGNGDASAR
jgi:acyl carrier protein